MLRRLEIEAEPVSRDPFGNKFVSIAFGWSTNADGGASSEVAYRRLEQMLFGYDIIIWRRRPAVSLEKDGYCLHARLTAYDTSGIRGPLKGNRNEGDPIPDLDG